MIRNTVLNVDGMSCRSCVGHVSDALQGLAGVTNVQVHLERGQVNVTHDDDRVSSAALMEALRNAGYEAKTTA